MIDFTLNGSNIYKVYFVGDYRTDEYTFLSSSSDEIKEFLMFKCFIFDKKIKHSDQSINELFDQKNDISKRNRHSFSFARGRYSYVKKIIKIEPEKKISPKINHNAYCKVS
jgi:hypothetical protein